MSNTFARLLSAACCISLSAISARADIVELLPRVKPAVVGVGSFHPLQSPRIKLMGTGFAVADGQHVVTNAHVPPATVASEKGESIAVFLRSAAGVEVRKAQSIASDPERDLALLRIEGAPLPTLRLGDAARAREGQLYYFTGYPIGAVLGLHPATHRAGLAAIAPVFSQPASVKNLTPKLIRRAEDSFTIFQLDATAYPGNSGSPLYDGESGEVIAVINSVFVKGAKENVLRDPSGITYAIPVQYVKALLERAGVSADGRGR